MKHYRIRQLTNDRFAVEEKPVGKPWQKAYVTRYKGLIGYREAEEWIEKQ